MSRRRAPDRSRMPALSAGGGRAVFRPLAARQPRFDRRRLRWLALASLALHLGVLAVALLQPQGGSAPPGPLPGEVSLVFTNAPATTPSEGRDAAFNEAPPSLSPDASSAPPPPPADVPPDPRSALLTPQQDQPPAPPAEPPPVPAPPIPAAPPVPFAPPAPPAASRPTVRVEPPRDPQAELPLVRPVPIPAAPAPLPPLAPAPRPPVPATPRQASRPPPPGEFPRPLNFSFGGSIADAQPHNAPQPRRGIDTAFGQTASGQSRLLAAFRGGNLSVDYQAALRNWWLEHRYYPDQALLNGEDGVVGIKITVARDGRVRRVELESRSGSQWLDLAGLGTFRNAKLPPFPPNMTGDETTFIEDLHYILIR